MINHPRFSYEEIRRIGEELYETKFRPIVETEANKDRIIFIDIETSEYEIGDDFVSPLLRFVLRRPDAAIYTRPISDEEIIYIGGGSITSMTPWPVLVSLAKD